jgi:two-component system, OmpR family, sensor histidine kinase CpxA
MSELVNELLSFSKASFGGPAVKCEPVLLRLMLEKAARREAAEPAFVVIDVAPELAVEADPDLLARAVANVLRNAVRHAGAAGPITVSAAPAGAEVVVTVADRGPGVPEEALAQLFDPFYRVDLSRDRATGGTGLGLAIVKTCVEACGGSVSCRNRQPTGLEVLLRLPRATGGTP